ncbi:unnamed protein product [Camellia sinensis]
MALPSTTQSWMNSTNIPNSGHDIPEGHKLLPATPHSHTPRPRIFFENDPKTALALTDYFGNTALHAVAVLGNIIEAKLVVERNPDLPNIWNNDGSLPPHLAAIHGPRKMTLFLLSVTGDDEESNPYEGEAGATLMRFAINVGFYV